MEPHYHLPFRPSDLKASSPWPALPPQPTYGTLSPRQAFSLQPQRHLPQGLAQTHPHAPLRYGSYHEPAMSTVAPYPAQQLFPHGQSYPLIPVQGVMSPPTSKGLPALPLPSHILPSQNANQGPCLACGKAECGLSSHRYFSKRLLTNARKRGLSSSQTSTPRVSQSALAVVPRAEQLPPQLSHMHLDTQREQLLSLWSKEWAPARRGPERHLFPIKFIDRVLPAAKAHPPLFQALLAYSGTIWAIANHGVSDAVSAQQAFAVELLSQACPTETEASTDEGMLAATLLLLIYMAQGNSFEVGKHVSGLVHLARLRGGPYYLGLSGLVAETLMYADHMQAIYFNQEPVWQLPLPALDIGLPPQFGRGFRQAVTTQEIDLSLALAAKSVCRVADVFEAAVSGRTLPAGIKNGFNYLGTIAEYQLARCNAVYNQTGNIDECICLALMLFNYIVLRNDGAITPNISQIEHRFWNSLNAAEAKGLTLSMLPGLYMWMVLTGLTVGIRTECHHRLVGVSKLRTARIAAGIHMWDQLRRSVLDEYVWLADAQEETFRRIWAEVDGTSNVVSTPVLLGQSRAVLPLAG